MELVLWVYPPTAGNNLDDIKQGVSDQIQWKGGRDILSLTVIRPPGVDGR